MKQNKPFYARIRRVLPLRCKGYITKLLYDINIKPTMNRNINSPLKKAVVVLSADFEMAWAFRASKTVKDATKRGLRERKNVPEIIALLDKYNIPITWATVGHLFLEKCSRKKNGKAHPNMPRPKHF